MTPTPNAATFECTACGLRIEADARSGWRHACVKANNREVEMRRVG